jgi:hypothetical protein
VNASQANQVYDVLQTCGAAADDRDAFVAYATRGAPQEWRFMGKLGFGGKFYFHDGRVHCYPEDETVERIEVMCAANAELTLLN